MTQSGARTRPRRRLKYWRGNWNGALTGLVRATSKAKAAEAAHTGLPSFSQFWQEVPADQEPSEELAVGVLYVRAVDAPLGTPWRRHAPEARA